MKKENRDYFIDMIKAFAIIAIMLWHFGMIPTPYFIWAIPIFIFSTAALYENKWKEIKVKSIIKKIIWISGLIIVFTLIFYLIGINPSKLSIFDYLKSPLYYFFLRNPQLGNLWYFLLYFQILIILLITSYLFRNKKIKLEKWYFGGATILISLIFSYGLLLTVGQGISFNVISWIFIIWLGLLNYSRIKGYFSKMSNYKLIIVFIISLAINLAILLTGGISLNSFIERYTHDFIFPTLIIQLIFFISLFSLSTIITRFAKDKILCTISLMGKYSLYIYLFHIFIYRTLLKQFLGSLTGFIFTLIICLILGYLLEKTREKILR